ncbi:hypothetical protein [Caldicellulosiruptor acetigenus]|uniref:hypothetical protein n=1 Tax=Caldicellulosiruptor acetigenus TaxID=301953 RepID=UPI0003FC4283|nr:hypothetical protein [Caldicellulosiruptor acetigenus]WAM35597.1 hypothetical protein OTK01_001947 [Caldicellulosiruptor acetigenus]
MFCYDWESLKREFLTGDYRTLKEFAEAKNISYGLLRNKAKGWTQEKRQVERTKSKLIVEKTLQKQIEKASDYNTLHVEFWDRLLELVWEALNDDKTIKTKEGKINIYALEKLSNVVEKVQKGQRLALGLDDKKDEHSEELLQRMWEIVQALHESDEATVIN